MQTTGATGPDSSTEAANEVLRLSGPGRAARAGLLLVLVGLFLAGSAVGQDDWWPFAPWRMFSTSTPPSGSVNSLRIEILVGNDPKWRSAPLTLETVGLNRAEVEGRVPEITADPSILGTLARSHARLQPEAPPWRGVRVVRHEVQLSDGAPTGVTRDTPIAEWRAR